MHGTNIEKARALKRDKWFEKEYDIPKNRLFTTIKVELKICKFLIGHSTCFLSTS